MRRGLQRAGVRVGLVVHLLLAAGIPRAGLSDPVPPSSSADGVAQERSVLIRIASDEHAELVRLAHSAAPVVAVRDGYALAWGPASALPAICGNGLDAEVLSERLPGREYAFVYTDGGGRAGQGAALASLGRVLYRGPHTAVIEYAAGTEAAVVESYVFVPIGDRPIELPAAHPLFRIPAADEPDPLVTWCVGQVDLAALEQRVQALQDFGTRRSESPVGRLAQQYIHEQFESFGLTDVTDFEYNAWCGNVVAVQPGTVAPGEIYVIGGHYDSFASGGLTAPGADDNASGAVGVLEAARIFSGLEFEATIIYIAFSGEEQGLVGSRAWAGYARDQGLDIRGMLNLDMIGYVKPGDVADLDLILRSESVWLRDLIVRTAGTYIPDFQVVDGYLTHGDSDHTSFFENGYYSVFFYEDSEDSTPHIHTTQDTIGPSLNSFEFMRSNVQVALAALATMARPLRVRITHTPLEDPPIAADGYWVQARIQSTAPIAEDSVQVRYAVDRGEFTWIPMAQIPGLPELWGAKIPKQAPGRIIQYAIRARDIEGRVGEAPVQGMYAFTVGLVPVFTDGFDADNGWTVGAADDSAATGLWVRATPVGTEAQPATDARGDSSGFCFVTANGIEGGEPGDADVDGGRTSLTSPRITLAGALDVKITFAYWYFDGTRPDDTLRVYLSNDDGADWNLVQSIGRSDPSWRSGTIAGMGLIPAPTDRMRLRFVAEDIGGPSLVEAAIDDVVIKAIIPPPEPPASARIVAAGPLPMQSGTGALRIVYDIAPGQTATLAIFDLQGRRIAELGDAPSTTGRQEALWDGRDEKGRTVAAGVYFLRLDVSGEQAGSVRIPVVR